MICPPDKRCIPRDHPGFGASQGGLCGRSIAPGLAQRAVPEFKGRMGAPREGSLRQPCAQFWRQAIMLCHRACTPFAQTADKIARHFDQAAARWPQRGKGSARPAQASGVKLSAEIRQASRALVRAA